MTYQNVMWLQKCTWGRWVSSNRKEIETLAYSSMFYANILNWMKFSWEAFQTILNVIEVSSGKENASRTHKKTAGFELKWKRTSDNVGTTRWATLFNQNVGQRWKWKKKKSLKQLAFTMFFVIYIQLTIPLYTLKKDKWTKIKMYTSRTCCSPSSYPLHRKISSHMSLCCPEWVWCQGIN